MSRHGLRAQHWDAAYGQRGDTDVSWFEAEPTQSLGMLDRLGIGSAAAVVDVGAGASRLVDALVTRGFADLTALDVSDEGLGLARARLGPDADRVRWVVADVLTWEPGRRFDVWHDRAVFHFLTDAADRARYVELLGASLVPGGFAVLATFAEDGPVQCSGLDVCRYSPAELASALGDVFEVVTSHRHEHVTPWGSTQSFTWLAVRRMAS